MEQSKHSTSHFQIKHKISLGVEVVSFSRQQSRESKISPIQKGKAITQEKKFHKGKSWIESGTCVATAFLVKASK